MTQKYHNWIRTSLLLSPIIYFDFVWPPPSSKLWKHFVHWPCPRFHCALWSCAFLSYQPHGWHLTVRDKASLFWYSSIYPVLYLTHHSYSLSAYQTKELGKLEFRPCWHLLSLPKTITSKEMNKRIQRIYVAAFCIWGFIFICFSHCYYIHSKLLCSVIMLIF